MELTVCQKEKIITIESINEKCCYYNIKDNKCVSDNYIIIYFEKETQYENGFSIPDVEVSFIINGNYNNRIKGTDKFTIKKGRKIEIYFKSTFLNLNNFFSANRDPNMKNVVSIDLSHLKTGEITEMISTFYGCESLKSIYFSNLNTWMLTGTNNMFYNCRSLEILDLSSFYTPRLNNLQEMFSGCESLVFLDISHFSFECVFFFKDSFSRLNNLQYVNLFNFNDPQKLIIQSDLNKIPGVTVCQRENLVTNLNANYDCCYYNKESKKCENNNFAILYFGKETTYENGFKIKLDDDSEFRKDIDFIVKGNRNSKILPTDKLIIEAGNNIEIYFSNSITSLENFFNAEKDNNLKNVIQINLSFLKASTITNMKSMFYGCDSLRKVDFSNIDTSNVKNMNSMFYECNSLEFIDLSYFDTSNVEDMSFMFYNCTKLEIIDLSYFDTSSVIYMNSMFNGCINLKLLDISRFNLEQITEADSMFKGLDKIKYINLNYIKDPNGYIAKSEINRNDITVCQKEKIVTKSTDNKCCYYNLDTQSCTNENYITIFFGDKAPYNNGFEKDKYSNVFRFDIDFIINGENHKNPLSGSDRIYLHRGSKLELYFLSDYLSLSNYFSAEKDINMKNIVSIYFSNLKIEWFLGINSLFYGCESLKTIVDFIAIDTISMDMSYMFYNCRSLEFIDLSSINLLYIDNCKSMFEGCESLRYLDISHFSFDYDDLNTDSMFKNVSKLEYINVYNVDDYYKKFSIIDSHNFIVCQKEDYKVILNNDTKTKCCYYDLKDKTCEDSNFIEIYYGEDVEYTNFENECRLHENIKYIINYDHNTKLSPKNYLKIKKGHKLEIYYSSPLESLEDYFSPSCDPNMKYIVSVDLSNFDTSSLTVMKSAFEDCEQLQSVGLYNFKGSSIISMNYVFSNCISLYIIDLSYLKLSSVIYMNNMFSGCTSLEVLDFSLSEIGSSLVNLGKMFYGCSSLVYLDLSNLITTSTTHMEQMFSGCTSLTYLDISNFNMEQIMNANSMFENVKSLKYINLYKTKDYNDYISKSELNNLVELTVCQTEQILKKKDVINKCCKYDFFEEECQDTNYIEIYYGEDVIYMEEEFGNDQRKNIDYIYKDHEYFHESEKLNIEKNTKVEIHFKEALESLAGFFCFDDENAKKIVSIDLSYLNTSNLKDISSMFSGCRSLQSVNFLYFNTSLVTNMNSLFEGCAQLESVDLSEFKTSLVSNMSKIFSGCSKLTSVNLYNFDTSSVVDMNNMFYGCSSIQSLDLSNFDTKKVTNFDSIFSGCTNLKVLDISNFNIKTDDNVNNMFDDITKLRYINLYHVEENDKFPDSDLLIFQDISVCQNVNKRIVKSDSIIERCCYFNIETDTCDNSNYIIVTFGEEDINYERGIEYGAVDGFYKNIRQGKIDFIIDKTDNNKKYNTSVKLNLKENTKIEIYLTNITSLQGFFNSDYDENAKQIISIDLSHLDGSSITDMSLMFKGCESLLSVNFSNFNTSSLTKLNSMFEGCEYIESIDLSYLNTSLVTDMNSLFYGCSQLKYVYLSNINTSKVENMKFMFWGCSSLISIDLSYFNTSSLTEIDSMFSGCSSLKVLDISNFNLNNITSNKSLFKNVEALRYINLYHVEDNKTIIQNSEITTIENLIVCEKEEMNTIVTENKRCCYFNIPMDKCEPDNYIIIYYGKESEYKNGFINKYRNDVSFIINGDYLNVLETNKEFKVNMGCKIELYFNSLMTSLESFFDYNYDKNIGNIKSIDFSHFKSSLITDMSKTFSGCNSLESIDFYNFNSESLKNMNSMFFLCDFLKSIDLSFFDVSKVTDMSYMLYGCSSLMSINTTNLDISSVQKMNSMFYECSSLENIDFSFYETPNLNNLEKMFYDCEKLSSLNLSKFDTSLVTNMKEIFYGCDNLIYIDISNFNMSKCENYNNMFSSTNEIKFINLFNLANDKTISQVFRKTKNLIFICQSEEIIKNPKAYNCCDYNFELDECENMPSTIFSTIEESTFISPQSTINTQEIFSSNIFMDYELTTTYFSERIDTTFIKESTELLAFSDIGSTISKEPSTFITEETEHFSSSNIKEDTESTTIYGIIDTTDKFLISSSEISFTTDNIDSTENNIPSTVPSSESDSSLYKESTIINSESSSEKYNFSTNIMTSNPTNSIKSSNIITDIEQMTTDFSENTKGNIDTTFIKQSTENMEQLDSTLLDNKAQSTNNNALETTYVPDTSNLLINTSFIGGSTLITSKTETQSESNNVISSDVNEVASSELITSNKNTFIKSTNILKETDLKTTSFTDNVGGSKKTTESIIKTTNIAEDEETSIVYEKENISTILSPKASTGIPTTTFSKNKQTTFNLESTSKEEITEKTTSIEDEVQKTTSKEINTVNGLISSDSEKLEQTTSKPDELEPTTSKPDELEPTTSKQETIEPTTSKPETIEPITSKPDELEPTTSKQETIKPTISKPEKTELTTSKPDELEPTTSIPEKIEPTTSKPDELEPTTSKQETIEPTTSKPEKIEPTTSKPDELEPTTSKPEKIEPTTSKPGTIEPITSKPDELEPTTSKPEKIEPTTSKPEKIEPTSSKPDKIEPTTSKPEQIESTSREVKVPEYSMGNTSNINQKTEAIHTTIPNHFNLTSIISPEIKIPTTIIENKIKTTTITDYGSTYVVLVGFSHFLKFTSYCTFYVHFRCIRGFIFSPSLFMNVRLINNRLLRTLQSQQAKCEKVNDDLENADYLCNVGTDMSNVGSLKIEDEFNFESQDIKVIGISPVAHNLMENVQNAEGEYDTLLQSNIYVLDHSIINTNNQNNTFNITGMIEDPKPTFEKIDLLLKINVKKLEDIIEADINCSITEIKNSNYTLSCQGEKDTLYNLQSAVSFLDNNDLLLVNFDENTTSEIIFHPSSFNYGFNLKNSSNGIGTGSIVAIVLCSIVALASIITVILLMKKHNGKTEQHKYIDSTMLKINNSI